MDNVITFDGQFYILAESSLADEQTHVLKYGDSFAVFDKHGDIRPRGVENHGIYHEGTRFLSHFVLNIEGKSPLLLSSTVKEDNDVLTVNLTNPDFHANDGTFIPRGSLYLLRTIFLWKGAYYERLRITNYARVPLRFTASFIFDGDFLDIFEVRGMDRVDRGVKHPPAVCDNDVMIEYEGLDKAFRRTHIHFENTPDDLAPDSATYTLELQPNEEFVCNLRICFESQDEMVTPAIFNEAKKQWKAEHRQWFEGACVIETTNELFNDWLARSTADLVMMLTKTPQGLYPYAGIPWFSTVFGRDGIISAMHTLWFDPDIARGVLSYLAEYQADEMDLGNDAEPGKIVHEQRLGEMAALKEIPFGNYYGTIDATPLFVVLAGQYYERTADMEFIRGLWPSIERALHWIDHYGDVDGDGFVEYERHAVNGLSHQGWKDSEDSVFHADGGDPEPPIALCEVQAYTFEAKTRAAQMASALGNTELAARLSHEAGKLRQRFHEAFWCDDLNLYALALDGLKRPCRVRTSNAGQCLLSGIASEEHARLIAKELMNERFFSGWGVRTLAEGEPRYNPMSYHNGSIWPHDNALIAAGLARYGHKKEASQILAGMFEAGRFLELYRLPELFCGFGRSQGEGPTLYPVACHPQTWASTSAFCLLQACLGLSVEMPDRKVVFRKPTLPPFLDEVVIRNLGVGDAQLDITLTRHAQDVGLNVTRKTRDHVEVMVVK